MKKISAILFSFMLGGISAMSQNAIWGDESKIDTLSYASGVNVAFGINQQFGYAPFDYDILEKTVANTSLGVATLEEDSLTLTLEQLPSILNDYFGEKYPDRLNAGKKSLDSLKVYDEKAYLMTRMFETKHERALTSKAFGMNLGLGINQSQMPVQVFWVLQGMRDFRNGKAIMDNNQASHYIGHYMNVTRVEEMKKRSSEWLASVAKEKGVKALPSGLLYKINKKGDKNIKALSDSAVVTVHYRGCKQSGEVFDSTRHADMPQTDKEDKAISFTLNQVIPGWSEGLKLIGKGGKITLWIPYNLAYGERGAGRVIAPYEALRFDVELVDVKN